MKRLLIVGGGIAGLSAAWAARRSDPSVNVTLVERDTRLGGKVRSDTVDGFLLEAGPDGFLSRKPAAVRLARELGITDQLIPRTPRAVPAFVMHEHALHPLPEGFSGMVPANLDALSRSALLSEQGRRRAAQEASIPAATSMDDESVAAFMRRRYGEEAFQLLIEPLVSGIYAADAERLSLAATIPHLRALELEYGSVSAALMKAPPSANGLPPFLSFRSGMGELVRGLVDGLDGVRIRRGTGVSSLLPRGRGVRAALADGSELDADSLILAVPARSAAALAGSLVPSLGALLDGIPFSSSALIHAAYREEDLQDSLDGYGYLIPAVEGSLLLGCTWSSRKWEGRAPEGTVLLRMHAGRYGRQDVQAMSDADLVGLCRDELAATMGLKAEPLLTRVQRWDEALPQYTSGHRGRVDAIERALVGSPGVFLAGSSYRGVGISDCIESGEKAAAGALDYLKGDSDHD